MELDKLDIHIGKLRILPHIENCSGCYQPDYINRVNVGIIGKEMS